MRQREHAQKMVNATCSRCAKQGRFARNPSCPRKNKMSNRYKQVEHVAVVCTTKKSYGSEGDKSHGSVAGTAMALR